jgi:hypothetical protein
MSVRNRACSSGVAALPVPGVDFGLQPVALRQEGAVAGREILQHSREPSPIGRRVDSRAWQRFALDESVQNAGDLQSVDLDVAHDGYS